MSIIVPTVTALDNHQFREEMERIEPFSHRLHIDIMDDEFANVKSVRLANIWWSEGKSVGIHMMVKDPSRHLHTLVALNPAMVVLHAESVGDLAGLATELASHGIVPGIAMLQKTTVDDIERIISSFRHALIFSGNLGHHGGRADLSLLDKAVVLRRLAGDIEIGWDGGINDTNAQDLVAGGVDVLNVGGFIQRSEHPEDSYRLLNEMIE